nr:hypothetical protein [Jannaschia donghaensis]
MDDLPMEALFLLTRSATPAFMVLFGVMLAVVYFRPGSKARTSDDLRRRFLSRAITCYLVYVCISAAAALTGKISTETFLNSITFTSGGRFGEILKIYAGLFFILIFFAAPIARYRLRFLMALAASAWLIKTVLSNVASDGLYGLQVMTGHGTGFGPSVLLSFTFVAFGFAIGEIMQGLRRPTWLILPIALAVGLMAYGANQYGGIVDIAREVGSYRLRAANHPVYYAYGILMTCLWLLLFRTLERANRVQAVRQTLGTLGKRSLYLYGMANIVLNLLPVDQTGTPLAIGLALTIAFIAGVILLTLDIARTESRVDGFFGGLFSALNRIYASALVRIVAWLVPSHGRTSETDRRTMSPTPITRPPHQSVPQPHDDADASGIDKAFRVS